MTLRVGPVTDAQFEVLLADAIEEGASFDTGLPDDMLDIFDLIFDADDEGIRARLIDRARNRWQELKEEFPEEFTD